MTYHRSFSSQFIWTNYNELSTYVLLCLLHHLKIIKEGSRTGNITGTDVEDFAKRVVNRKAKDN